MKKNVKMFKVVKNRALVAGREGYYVAADILPTTGAKR